MSSPELKTVFSTLGQLELAPILVGGAVRDLVLKRPVNDYDFVVQTDATTLVSQIKALSSAAGCTVIPLDKERGVIRYCFSSEFYVDVAVYQGESLEHDLMARDFSINALAMDEAGDFVDPSGGLEDLRNGVVRVLGESALDSDPLRVLRGFRMAAVLGFQIEPNTLKLLYEKAPLLTRVAGERIAEECFKLFAKADWPLMAHFRDARILDHLWSGVTELGTWKLLEQWYGQEAPLVGQELIRDQRSDRELSMLAALMSCRAENLVTLAERFKLSTEEVKYLNRWWKTRQTILAGEWQSARQLYRLIKAAGNALAGVLSFLKEQSSPAQLSRIRAAAQGGELRWEPLPISGGELCQHLGRQPGKWVGEVLGELELAWATREVENLEKLWDTAKREASST